MTTSLASSHLQQPVAVALLGEAHQLVTETADSAWVEYRHSINLLLRLSLRSVTLEVWGVGCVG